MFRLLLLLGFSAIGVCLSRQYHFINRNKTWAEAQRYCRENYVDLATIDNVEEELALIKTVDIRNASPIWIGLYDDLNSWKWSLDDDDDDFYQEAETSFRNWYIQKPEKWYENSLCAIFSGFNGAWEKKNCSDVHPFICFDAKSSASSHVHHFVNESKTWLDAQSYCRENYTDLATIDNMEEINTLLKTVNGSYADFAWIGGYDDLDSWRWSLDEDSERGSGWNREPDNYNGKELCVFIRSDGKWSDGDCNNHLTFVCYNGRTVTEGYVWVNQLMPWAEAQHYCRQHYKDLASVRNQADNEKIRNLTGGFEAWIGLYRTRVWSDQHVAVYENWRPATTYGPGQPDNGLYASWEQGNQQCAAVSLSDSGQWTDEDCLATFPFICYSKLCTGSLCTHQYDFITENMTWTEAQSYCREKYTDLATIENMEDMGSLLDTVYGTYSGLAWIGLYDDLNSWKWSLDDGPFYRGKEKSFRNWFQYKQRNWFGNTLCVHLSGLDGIWWGASCYISLAFICFDGRVNAGERYVLVYQYLNWTEAQRYCREHYTDLVSVRNESESQKIRLLLYKYNYSRSVWIGLYTTRSWSDKSNSSFSNWYPGQPDNSGQDEYCTAVLTESGKWADENCGQDFPFFCYSSTRSISHQYHFVNESKNWTQAQRYCRESYTDLATIDNVKEMNSLLNAVNESYWGLAWIGLYDNLNDWRWSLDDDAFYEEGEREFRGWYHEPNNYGGNELCVSMYYTGEWFDLQCNQRLGFVCYNGTSNMYVWVSEKMTWEEAQRFCRANHTDLASVRNETELKKILSVTQDFEVWIGLYRNRLWSDQSNSTFAYWRPEIQTHIIAEPDNGLYSNGQLGNQNCTAMDNTGKWTDENCSARFPFFCYSVTTPEYGTSTTGAMIELQVKMKFKRNMLDSRIKDLFSIHFQRELSRLGLSRTFTLRVKTIQKVSP